MTDGHPPDEALVAEVLDPLVVEHLRGCPECRSTQRMLRRYLDAKVAEPEVDLAPQLAALFDRELSPRLPEASESFVLEERQWIGTSDRGHLYAVFDRARQRRVALKVLRDADGAHIARVAAAIDAVRHPNLAPYLDVVQGDPVHVTRELVDGEPLDVALDRADNNRKILRWLGLLASALSALHSAGVAHGALTPSNVRIEPHGRLVVLDAGLAAGDATPADDWLAVGRILQRHAPQLFHGPTGCPYAVPAVLERMLDADPARRPSGHDVLASLLLEQGLGGLEATRYEIRERIDQGGMGELLRAWDPVLQREVALKRIAGGVGSVDAAARFLREARVAAQLQHPNIVPVHEQDRMPDGTPFFTMKLIQGQELGKVIASGSLVTLIQLFAKLCDAVAHAHSRGVLHLDLKPRNVLVGKHRELQLIDWGAAWLLQDTSQAIRLDGLALAQDKVAGTRGYMPPEQAEGRIDEIGRHSDVYALGAILFQILTRTEPSKDSPCPRVRSVTPSAPPELASIADKALKPRHQERYPDAEALGRDIRAWLAGERVEAHEYSLLDSLERRTRRRRGWIGLSLVSLLAVGTVGWFAFLGWEASAVAQARERERQGLVLAEQARFALVAGDRVEAERRAAAAVTTADTPEGRGLLVRLGRSWYPSSAGTCSVDGTEIRCATASGVVQWDPALPASTCERHPLSVDGGELRLGDQILSDRFTTGPVCDRAALRVAFAAGGEVLVWKLVPALEEDAILDGHDGGVAALAWSHDGRRLATADAEGRVRLWDAVRGVELARLPGHGAVSALSFAERSTLLVVAGDTPRAWDLRPPEAPDRIDAMVPLVQVAWDEGGLGTLDRQGKWRGWDPQSGRFTGDEFRQRDSTAADVALSPDASAVAVVTTDGGLWVQERGPTRDRWHADAAATTVAWESPAVLVTGDREGRLKRWDAVTGEPLAALASEGAAIVDLEASDGLLLVRREDGLVELAGGRRWTGASAATVRGGQAAVALGDRGRIVVGDVTVADLGSPALALALSPAADAVAAIAEDHTARLYVRDEGAWVERARVIVDLRTTPGLAFSPDGDALAVIGLGTAVELWDTSILDVPPADLVAAVDARYGETP